jgi:aminoglycoside 2'-N-acetyltransferase I
VARPGPTCVLTPGQGIRRTPDEDGGIYVFPVPGTPLAPDPAAPLVCDWRDGDVW